MGLELAFAVGEFAFDPAEVHFAYAQVGGDIVLGNALDDVWALIEQVLVTLFRGVSDEGDKFVGVMGLSLGSDLEEHLYEAWFVADIFE